VELLIELRQDLRKAGQYSLADRIRERLTELGIVLEDGKQRTTGAWLGGRGQCARVLGGAMRSAKWCEPVGGGCTDCAYFRQPIAGASNT